MPSYNKIKTKLASAPRRWLITGVAGFIGSNLLETLLTLNQTVIGLDNLSTGHPHNLDEVRQTVAPDQWHNFSFGHLPRCMQGTLASNL